MPKRTSMKGRGADAWFAPEQPEAVSTPEPPSTSIPASQHTNELQKQELVKATFYLTKDNITALEELRLKLLKEGKRVDKSQLIRQAIELLASQHTSKTA